MQFNVVLRDTEKKTVGGCSCIVMQVTCHPRQSFFSCTQENVLRGTHNSMYPINIFRLKAPNHDTAQAESDIHNLYKSIQFLYS